LVVTGFIRALISPRGLGLMVAAATVAVDQANKLWLMFVYDIADRQPVPLTPFLDVVFAKNPGISYSLLPAKSEAGRFGLVIAAVVVTMCLLVWLYRSATRTTAVALGMIIGGGLGNAYDRFAYGFVADFYHFHLDGFSWYVFNLADVAVVAGVGLLLLESVFLRGASAPRGTAQT
jgi:signal peptidase II